MADLVTLATELLEGERVRVTFDATVGAINGSGPALRLDIDDETWQWIDPQALPHVTITRLEPIDGIPQPGDLWTDRNGTLYAAIPWLGSNPPTVQLINARDGGAGRSWDAVHRSEQGPIRLHHRPPAKAES